MKMIMLRHAEASSYIGRALALESAGCAISECRYSFYHPILGKHVEIAAHVYEVVGHISIDSIKSIMQYAAVMADAEFFVVDDGKDPVVIGVKGWVLT